MGHTCWVSPPVKRRSSRSIGEAKAHFAECVREAEAGLETILTRHGRPVARVVPYDESSGGGDGVREGSPGYAPVEPEVEGEPAVAESASVRRELLHRFLEEEIRPLIPERLRGTSLSKAEKEQILGYGERGV